MMWDKLTNKMQFRIEAYLLLFTFTHKDVSQSASTSSQEASRSDSQGVSLAPTREVRNKSQEVIDEENDGK